MGKAEAVFTNLPSKYAKHCTIYLSRLTTQLLRGLFSANLDPGFWLLSCTFMQ
jgi:hypothetical protein